MTFKPFKINYTNILWYFIFIYFFCSKTEKEISPLGGTNVHVKEKRAIGACNIKYDFDRRMIWHPFTRCILVFDLFFSFYYALTLFNNLFNFFSCLFYYLHNVTS